MPIISSRFWRSANHLPLSGHATTAAKGGTVEFTDYLWLKLITLCVLAFVANFLYRLFTGRSLERDLSDTKAVGREDRSKSETKR
jgi:Na+/H+ antiporter NhaD/arsenite permease-like protein